jgi:hypothetical protein
MPQELIYTYAPKGLRPGTQGFCTVAMSRGLATATVQLLETLSASYRSGPRGGPTAISFIQISVGSKVLHILSRIASIPGPRPNHLAHHIILDSAERSAAGPAWLASHPNLFITAWQEPPRHLSVRSLPAGPELPPSPPTHWTHLTGNPLWAEALAEVWMMPPSQPLYLIVPPQLDPLPLIAESIALLPPQQRWQATFTTAYFGLPAEANCRVRVVLAGSELEPMARQFGGWDLATLGQHAPPPATLLRQALGQRKTQPSPALAIASPATASPAIASPAPAFGPPAPANAALVNPAPTLAAIGPAAQTFTAPVPAPASGLPVFDPDAPPLLSSQPRPRSKLGLLIGLVLALGLAGLAVYCVVLLNRQQELTQAVALAEQAVKDAQDKAQAKADALAEAEALIQTQRNRLKELQKQVDSMPQPKDKTDSSEPVVFKKALDEAEAKVKELMEEKAKLDTMLDDLQAKLKEVSEAKIAEWNQLIFAQAHSVEFVVDISVPAYRKEAKELQAYEFELPAILSKISPWYFSESKVENLMKENSKLYDKAKTEDTRTKTSITLCFKLNEKEPMGIPFVKVSVNEKRDRIKAEWVIQDKLVDALKIYDIQSKLSDEVGKKYTTIRVPLQNASPDAGPVLLLQFRSYSKIGKNALLPS